MEQLVKDIYKILSCYNTYADELPLKDEFGEELDYLNNSYVTYKIGNSSDRSYKDIYDLEVQVITNKVNKFIAQKIGLEIESKLNKTKLTNARINRKNAWLVRFVDEDSKENIVLQYDINIF